MQFLRVACFIHQRNNLNLRLMNLTRKLEDLQRYAANIADGSISMSDMMDTPPTMFARQMMFMTYSHNASIMAAQQNYGMMMPMMQMQMQNMDPNAQLQYQQWVFRNLYNQQREAMGRQESKLLNEQEKQIQKEKATLETQLKMLEQEYEAVKQGEDNAIKNLKPEYTA